MNTPHVNPCPNMFQACARENLVWVLWFSTIRLQPQWSSPTLRPLIKSGRDKKGLEKIKRIHINFKSINKGREKVDRGWGDVSVRRSCHANMQTGRMVCIQNAQPGCYQTARLGLSKHKKGWFDFLLFSFHEGPNYNQI